MRPSPLLPIRAALAVAAISWLLTLPVACDGDSDLPGSESDVAVFVERSDVLSEDSEATDAAPLTCNGHAHLCARLLDEISFVRTHNGHAALEEGFHEVAANHRFAIPRQLKDGVRSVNVDVYFEDGLLHLCHGMCMLGITPLDTALGWIRDFLDAHTRDVLLLDLQNKAPVPEVAVAFEEAGLGLEDLVIQEQEGIHPPKFPLGKAIAHALKNWEALTEFLKSSKTPIDNNASERALRVAALGRKNYLFSGRNASLLG